MKKLILHIGSHKTGTTSIQKALWTYRENMRKSGISPLLENQSGIEFSSNHGWAFYNQIGNVPTFVSEGAKIRDGFFVKLDAESNKYDTVVVSSEEFSFLIHKESIKKLSQRLYKIFDEICVVAYLRRQDRHLVSHHQQSCRAPGAVTQLFGNDPVAMPDYDEKMDLYLDYNTRIGFWGDCFGDNNVKIRLFDSIAKEKGVVKDFFSLLDLSFQPDEIRDNQSLCKSLEKIKHLSMQLGFSREESLKLNKYFQFDEEKMKPSRSDSMELMDKYNLSNAMLLKRFNIDSSFDDDFDLPESDNSDWSESSANNVIKILLGLLKDKLDSL